MSGISNVVFNSNNFVIENNKLTNQLRYQFPVATDFSKKQVGISSISLYNSFFNVQTQYFNNTILITMPYYMSFISGNNTGTLILNDGYYSVENINTLIENFCIENGYYAIQNNSPIFFFQMQDNAIQYKIELDFYLVQQSGNSSSLFTIPLNAAGIPFYSIITTGLTMDGNFPQFGSIGTLTPMINFNDEFGSLIGFNNASTGINMYPPTNPPSKFQYLSNTTPSLNIITSLIITCNLVNNTLAIPNNVLGSIAISVPSGAYLSQQSPQISFSDCNQSQAYYIQITLWDQNLKPVYLNDNDILIVIAVRDRLIASR